jgi:hypothetical protein
MDDAERFVRDAMSFSGFDGNDRDAKAGTLTSLLSKLKGIVRRKSRGDDDP